MTPAAITAILQAVSLAATTLNSEEVKQLVESTKAFFTHLFKGGVVPKEQQAAIWAFVDSIAMMVEAGITPPHWQVQPDPSPAS